MARATIVDALSANTLASSVSIGGSSLTLDSNPGSYMPSGAGVFSLLIIEDDFTDAELVNCTRSGTTCTLDSMTFAKDHAAGAYVKYVVSAADFAAKADASALTTHESDTTSVHGITDTAQVALKNAANTFTANQRVGSGTTQGSTAAPAITIGGTTSGLAVPSANNLTLSANATEVLRLLSTEFRVQKRMRLNGPLGFDTEIVDLTGGGDYTRTSATLIMVSVYADTAGCTIYLDAPSTSDFQVIRNQTGSTESIAISNGDTLAPGAGNLYVYDANEGQWSSF